MEIIKKEKEATTLSKVEEDFYIKLRELVEKKEKEKEKSPLFMIEYENIRRLARKVVEIRTKKIMFLALNEIEAPNSINVEKEFYEEIRRALKKFEEKVWRGVGEKREREEKNKEEGKEEADLNNLKEDIERRGEIRGEEQKKEEEREEIEEIKEKIEEEAKDGQERRIKIRSYVEAYRGIDGIIYGPYSPGEIIKINKEEAKWLVENGYAEFV